MPDPPSSDPQRLRRADRQRFRLRLRREVRRAQLGVLAFGVLVAGFLALHLAQRGNEVSLTARSTATSPTTAPGPDHVKPRTATNPPSEETSPARTPPSTATVTVVPPLPPIDNAPPSAPDTATNPEADTTSTTSTSTTSTSTTTSTTTTSTTTTTTTAPPPP
jgi:hypothetical protein